MYTSGVWLVKEGREDEFVRRWQETADAATIERGRLKFMLLRDRENPGRFVSLGEGWRNAEEVEAVRGTPAYQDAMSAMWRLLDSGHLATLELAVEVS